MIQFAIYFILSILKAYSPPVGLRIFDWRKKCKLDPPYWHQVPSLYPGLCQAEHFITTSLFVSPAIVSIIFCLSGFNPTFLEQSQQILRDSKIIRIYFLCSLQKQQNSAKVSQYEEQNNIKWHTQHNLFSRIFLRECRQ